MSSSTRFKFVVVFLVAMSVWFPPATASAALDQTESTAIIAALQNNAFTRFSDFLEAVQQTETTSNRELNALISRYQSGAMLNTAQQNDLYRLLGLYTRIRYGDEAIALLIRLVAIPTFQVETIPQYENPEFHRFATDLEAIVRDFGLQFRNVDQRVYEVSLNGSGDELIGIHAHADVVPVNPALWVLDDGTRLDPFKVSRIGNRLYGRGTQDDKVGIVAALYAMKVIQDERLPLLRSFRLLIDTTEETTGEAIPYYFERNSVPDYNIALDGTYPVVIAEKGFGTVMAQFPVRRGQGEGAEVISISGGVATNQIPSTSTVLIRSATPGLFAQRLNERGSLFAAALGGNFQTKTAVTDGQVRFDIIGVSAHSSAPQTGINPVSRMLEFIDQLYNDGLLQSNHITDAARYAEDNWGLDYYGNTLGVAFSNEFMGPLTTAQTFVALDADRLRTAVNLRIPVGRAPESLLADIRSKLNAWQQETGISVNFDLSAAEPMYRNPEGAWVNALLDIAVENLAMPREFGSSAGATSIHDLPNGVQFGLAMPNEKYTGHNANEFKTVDQMMLDMQIVTEMFARLGTMPAL